MFVNGWWEKAKSDYRLGSPSMRSQLVLSFNCWSLLWQIGQICHLIKSLKGKLSLTWLENDFKWTLTSTIIEILFMVKFRNSSVG